MVFSILHTSKHRYPGENTNQSYEKWTLLSFIGIISIIIGNFQTVFGLLELHEKPLLTEPTGRSYVN